MSATGSQVAVVLGERLARYGFPDGHPFGPDRYAAFLREFEKRGLCDRVTALELREASAAELEQFHSAEYIRLVRERSQAGGGWLDAGDTPAFRGVFEAASGVVGATLAAAEWMLAGPHRRGFVPIAGLHHAARGHAAGFCVFNDCGVLIERLLRAERCEHLAYVDIDAHHGDGVFYGFEREPRVIVADLHESGATLYPGTGSVAERGLGQAEGTKLNIPLPPGANDAHFNAAWPRMLAHVQRFDPAFIILQCGADSLAGDPIAHLRLSFDSHARAARDLCALADRLGHGRVLALGGGGYDRRNLACGWCAVLEQLISG